MKLHDLKPAPGSKTKAKRVGRGIGSGIGKTSGKGHKGAKARSGGGKAPGQMPLMRRIPKSGFKNIFRKEYAEINIQSLERFEDGTVVNLALLREAGMVSNAKDGLKVLGGGEFSRKLTVQASRFTGSAREKIEQAGGKAEEV
jgi:large subunit ribosomal protein L15